ncbi:ferrochelatase [Demequina capsici]|uniref:Coproporphyrin III ferrochelatase n=1 Tax=Demequina capsici TaxID=3075620 RepID=A0AA96FAC7_9MICO|nr:MULTISPECIES: ferrochelatase [unclassified Demequina]WNM25076.1 ferrochelatase [Demequina sp. OYTSA14]WNM27982.1 ferrochelatase [Demequina sp. PMTSA13]
MTATLPALAASTRTLAPATYDCILLAGFGGPEGQDDVIPYLRNVTRGRGVPDERLEEVAHHYRHFGGISPINQQNRDLKVALEAEIERRGLGLPVYWGNRFWAPYFTDALKELHADGHRRVLVLVTTAFSSYSGCRAYREDLAAALDEAGLAGELVLDKVRQYFDHPGFVEPNVDAVLGGLRELSERGDGDRLHVMFATHSIPSSAADVSGPREALPDGTPVPTGGGEEWNAGGGWYVEQQRAVAALVMDRVADEFPGVPWSLVFQSRSGDPRMPWLEPDINLAIEALPESTTGLVISPLGFVSDHMEVAWDLDNEALETCEGRELSAVRVPTVGVDPAFVAGLIDLVEERHVAAAGEAPREREALTTLGPWQDVCPADCCLGRAAKPTIASAE